MGVPHAGRRADGSPERGGAAVDGELSLPLEDDEHLLALVVEVVSNAAARHDLAAVHEIEIGGQGVLRQAFRTPCRPRFRVSGSGDIYLGRYVRCVARVAPARTEEKP